MKRIALVAAGLALAALLGGGARADDPAEPRLVLTLTETVAEAAGARWTTVTPGSITETGEDGSRTADYSWSEPPRTIGAEGFTIMLMTGAQAGVQAFAGGTRVAGTDFKFDPDPPVAELQLEAGQADTVSTDVTVTPRWGLTEGETVELTVGVQWGPSVHYRYRVSYEQPDRLAHERDDLTAELDCPDRIEISRLPSLSCHVTIAGWKRDGGPVELILPKALDDFGNHGNGIQISGAGERPVSAMGAPYSWGLKIFACPGKQGPGVNCLGNAAVPGETSTPIIVRQEGREDVLLTLTLDAEGEAVSDGGAAAAPDDLPPEGPIEAKLDCPTTIAIGAPAGITCNIVITKWRGDTIDPVFVLLPGAVDSFGNHANGLQVKTEQEERIFGWEAPHLWAISIVACPGINCFANEAKPGPLTLDLVIRQNGMSEARLTLALEAIKPPPPVAPN